MNYSRYVPGKIILENAVVCEALTRVILARFPGVPVEQVNDANEFILEYEKSFHTINTLVEKPLLIARQRGPFVRLCPGTQKHICCLYYNLDLATNCHLGCSYCILQCYLNNPFMTIYANLDDMVVEIEQLLTKNPNRFYRIGSGELSDSLIFNHFTNLSQMLIELFATKKNAIIELKTKTDEIEYAIGPGHNRRTVLSWSLNAEAIVATEEKGAPSIDSRIAAARVAQEAGYWIGFHFDPIIDHPGWEQGYHTVVDKIFAVIKPENIAWISLGALRYPPSLEDLIHANHPDSRITLGELFPGMDGKMRYFRPIRVEMFKKMYRWIKHHSEKVLVYLCMESNQVWYQAFGWSPKSSARLKKLLDRRVM